MKTEKGTKEGGRKTLSVNHFPESEKISDYSVTLRVSQKS